ncbi:TMEM16D protein [Cricetulus griseus]|uniref:TMEM16D protein n=1 Tax=Cricetulus griseus TaxID=10029 RepID=A0A061ILP6_CRIGR|nr:TMEM16D protein [Cricetulus griseus]
MASLTAYDKDVSSASYNLSSATSGSYYSCVSQITIGYDVAGPVAIGLTHWKNPYVQGRPTLPSDLPLFLSKDAGIPVYHQSFTRKADLATPLSCPASLSITPVPSYSSSSQETLSQDTTECPILISPTHTNSSDDGDGGGDDDDSDDDDDYGGNYGDDDDCDDEDDDEDDNDGDNDDDDVDGDVGDDGYEDEDDDHEDEDDDDSDNGDDDDGDEDDGDDGNGYDGDDDGDHADGDDDVMMMVMMMMVMMMMVTMM